MCNNEADSICVEPMCEQPLLDMYYNYLGVTHFSEVAEGYKPIERLITVNESEELYVIPSEVTVLLSMNDVSLPYFSQGFINFCEYNGVRFIMEQNASPFLMYRKHEGT